MIGLLRTYLAPYRGRLLIVAGLLLIQAIGNLYLPDLNGDIINNGVVLGDLDYIVRVGLFMLVITALVGAAAIASVYLSAAIANGFARDVRSAVFGKVETFANILRPSLTKAKALQKRRGMVPSAQGLKAISRTRSKPSIWRSEFQKRPSFSAKRAAMVSRPASQAGSTPS